MAKYEKKSVVDIGLTALCNSAAYGQTLELQDIADVCECSRQYILITQNNALRKLRRAINFNDHMEV